MKLSIEFETPEELHKILKELTPLVEQGQQVAAQPASKPQLKPVEDPLVTDKPKPRGLQPDGSIAPTIVEADKPIPRTPQEQGIPRTKVTTKRRRRLSVADTPTQQSVKTRADAKLVDIRPTAKPHYMPPDEDETVALPPEDLPKPPDATALFSKLVQTDIGAARKLLQGHGLARFSEADDETLSVLVTEAQELLSGMTH